MVVLMLLLKFTLLAHPRTLWSSCSLYHRRKSVFRPSQLRSMDRTKGKDIAASESAQIYALSVGPSEGHSLLEKSQHARRTWRLIQATATTVRHMP
jgi:hypothetical protein